MSDGPIPAGRGVVPGQLAEIIVALDGEPGRRGSGYRVGPGAVLTAAHVIENAVLIRVRFDADLPGEWVTEATSYWADPRSDLAVLSIVPREEEPPVAVARFGRIGSDRAAVLAAQAVGFPRFKLKNYDGVEDHPQRYRDSHQADGSVAVLSNRREGTLEVTVPPPERDPAPAVSPWEGMSGAAVWVGDRIVGVIAQHHRSDGLGRLAAARLDLALEGLNQARRAELRRLLGLPDVLPDVVPSSAGERLTTAYQAQVRDIAPDYLLDRDAELDKLVGFCAGDQPYAWWQADPWAGKSALMAWFVLHPPAGVDVVSFFITARLAGQSDSDACTNALIEQLAALVGEPPGLLTAGPRRGNMLRLLDDAASRSREGGRRLLLVIDGLDEDSGTVTGRSIAALLPHRPPAEVRVLVASRPHPPIPEDVVDNDHPLRTITPRQLDVSEYARDIQRRAKHELKQLLAGEQLHRDVLRLITAAGGGLTLDDLEQLTERPPFEIEHLLGGVFGRSVGRRIGTPSAGYPDERVYLFTHETLRLVAEQQFGNSLAAYRDRLHAWADTWRHQKWPTDTPQYLLRSYPRMLASIGDLTRLVACATDQARHDRMRDLTGGHALAFTEISTAQQLIFAQPDPDLTSLALLAVEREHLIGCNIYIPTRLPAVWAKLGQPIRAEGLANSNPDPIRRVLALAQLTTSMAGSGDYDRATRLAGDAVALTEQISNPYWRGEALAQLAQTAATSGDHDRAKALAAQITDLRRRAETLARLAEPVAVGGDHDRAARLAGEAETLAGALINRYWRAGELTRLAEAVAIGGDHDRAAQLAGEAETLIRRVGDPAHLREALSRVGEAMAAGGDHDRGELFAWQNTDPYPSVRLVEVVAASGGPDRAEMLAGRITDSNRRARVLARLTQVVAADGDHERAARLAGEVEALTGQVTDPESRAEALARVGEAMAACGDHDRAARLADEAETLAGQITNSDRRARALTQIMEVMAAGGNHDRAARLAGDAEALTGWITSLYWRAEALARIAQAMTAGGDHDRAARLADQVEALAGQITDPKLRAEALARVAAALIADGDHDRTARLSDEAEALAGQITNPDQRAEALVELARILVEASKETSLVPEHVRRSSPLMVRARRLLAEALAVGSWTAVVSSLAHVEPLAVTALADDVQARWIRHKAGR